MSCVIVKNTQTGRSTFQTTSYKNFSESQRGACRLCLLKCQFNNPGSARLRGISAAILRITNGPLTAHDDSWIPHTNGCSAAILPPILPSALSEPTLTSIRCNLELDVRASPLLIGSYIRCDFKILRCRSAVPHFNFPLSQGSLMLEGCQLVVNLPPGELVTAWECDHDQSWYKNKTKGEIIRINVRFSTCIYTV